MEEYAANASEHREGTVDMTTPSEPTQGQGEQQREETMQQVQIDVPVKTTSDCLLSSLKVLKFTLPKFLISQVSRRYTVPINIDVPFHTSVEVSRCRHGPKENPIFLATLTSFDRSPYGRL